MQSQAGPRPRNRRRGRASPSTPAGSSSLRKPSFSSHSICSSVGRAAATSLSAHGCRVSRAHGSSGAVPAVRARFAASSACRSCAVLRRLTCPAMVYTLSPAAAADPLLPREPGFCTKPHCTSTHSLVSRQRRLERTRTLLFRVCGCVTHHAFTPRRGGVSIAVERVVLVVKVKRVRVVVLWTTRVSATGYAQQNL